MGKKLCPTLQSRNSQGAYMTTVLSETHEEMHLLKGETCALEMRVRAAETRLKGAPEPSAAYAVPPQVEHQICSS